MLNIFHESRWVSVFICHTFIHSRMEEEKGRREKKDLNSVVQAQRSNPDGTKYHLFFKSASDLSYSNKQFLSVLTVRFKFEPLLHAFVQKS